MSEEQGIESLIWFIDEIRNVYSADYAFAVSPNTYARLQAISAHKPFAHRRKRKSLARMGRALREKVKHER